MVGDTVVEGQNILASDDVTWQYTVTNDPTFGNQALSNVTVTDDNGTPTDPSDDFTLTTPVSGDANNNGLLDVGETWIFTASASDHGGTHAGAYQNTGIATGQWTGTDNLVHTPHDDDSSNYFGVTLGVDIQKQIVDSNNGVNNHNGVYDADGSTGGPVLLAASVDHFNFVVTNNSNIAQVIHVSDPLLGYSADTLSLAAGESATLATAMTWAAGPNHNTATASIDYDDDAGQHGHVDATNDANYFGAYTGIHVEKITTSSHGSGDGINVFAGETIGWQYTVTNTGNVALGGIAVTDNVAGVNPTAVTSVLHTFNVGDLNDDHKLDTNESWVFTASGTAIKGPYSNIGTATGSFTDSAGNTETPSDDDGSSYMGFLTGGLSKGYWSNDKAHPWSTAIGSDCKLVVGDNEGDSHNVDNIANDTFDLTLGLTVAKDLVTSSATGDARIIMGGQLVAAQLNADVAGKTAYGLLEQGAKWFFTFGGQDSGGAASGTSTSDGTHTQAGDTVTKNEWSGKFLDGSVVSTSSSTVGQWNTGNFFTHTDNSDPLHPVTASVTGEGLKNVLMAYDHGISGTTDGLVVSGDGSLIGWQHGSAINHVYANTSFDNVIAVVNDANNHELADAGIHLAGISHT